VLSRGIVDADGGLLEHLPEGLRKTVGSWAHWNQALGSLSLPAIKVLPYVALLLLDASNTGLKHLAAPVEGPLGLLGMSVLVSNMLGPLFRFLIAAAGRRHAKRAYGGHGWLWVFWLGWANLADQWWCGHWRVAHADRMDQIVELLRTMSSDLQSFTGLQQCHYCWRFCAEGAQSDEDNKFYCEECNTGWKQFMSKKASKPSKIERNDSSSTLSEVSEQGHSWSTSSKPLPEVRHIDFAESEVNLAESKVPCCIANGLFTKDMGNRICSDVAKVAERVTGISAAQLSDSLEGLESLKVIALGSALRREMGINLRPPEISQCRSLADLERMCMKGREDAKLAMHIDEKAEDSSDLVDHNMWAIFAIPRFWQAPVGWLLKLHEFPSEKAMRIACRALVLRHVGLRAYPQSMAPDAAIPELINRAAPNIIAMQDILALHCHTNLFRKACRAFLSAWPTVSVTQCASQQSTDGPEVAHFEWKEYTDFQDLRHEAWQRARSRGFRMPLSIAVLVHATDDMCTEENQGVVQEDKEAYLHISVNHAVCDAACIVPLMADLLSLHQAALDADNVDAETGINEDANLAAQINNAATATLASSKLPALPNSLALQQERLRKGLEGIQEDSLDLAHCAFHPRRRGYDYYMKLGPDACKVLEAAAASTGIPADHMLVVVIALGFYCVMKDPRVKLTLLVPMRDSDGEGFVIANLATTRHISVWVKDRSFIDIALNLSSFIRRREWTTADVLGDDGDRLFLNVRSLPSFFGASPVIESIDTRKGGTQYVNNVVEMFADQESAEMWTLSMGIRDDVDGNRFAQGIKSALWCMATNPCQRVDDVCLDSVRGDC